MTLPLAPDRAPWWLRGAHGQTTWSRLARSRRMLTYDREVLTTPDGDDLVLDHVAGPAGTPRVLLLHGLEGSAHSFHSQALAFLIKRAGWRVTVLNFRSCARDPARITRRLRNRTPRLYHSGDTADLDLVVRLLCEREPQAPLYALGFSLGGNVLLKWLGESGAQSFIRAAATISVPYDLAAASQFLERRVGRFYAAHFLRRLKPKALDVIERFPAQTAHLDAVGVQAARTFHEFDDKLTAPLHGFASVDDYYTRCSSRPFLSRIRVPTLCISSSDDPFIPNASIAEARQVASSDVTFIVTPWGGHTGFVTGRWPWRPVYWAEEEALAWLQNADGGQVSAASVAVPVL